MQRSAVSGGDAKISTLVFLCLWLDSRHVSLQKQLTVDTDQRLLFETPAGSQTEESANAPDRYQPGRHVMAASGA